MHSSSMVTLGELDGLYCRVRFIYQANGNKRTLRRAVQELVAIKIENWAERVYLQT